MIRSYWIRTWRDPEDRTPTDLVVQAESKHLGFQVAAAKARAIGEHLNGIVIQELPEIRTFRHVRELPQCPYCRSFAVLRERDLPDDTTIVECDVCSRHWRHWTEDIRWSCYRCDRVFRSEARCQAHEEEDCGWSENRRVTT